MNRDTVTGPNQQRPFVRVCAVLAAGLLLPPFVLLAIVPMLLMLVPVAMVGIPFLIPALVSGPLAEHGQQRRIRLRVLPRMRVSH